MEKMTPLMNSIPSIYEQHFQFYLIKRPALAISQQPCICEPCLLPSIRIASNLGESSFPRERDLPFGLASQIMEALAAIGLVGNIVQFVEFSGKLISKSIQLHHSYVSALIENVDTENATKHLMVLNKKLKDDNIVVGDGTLYSLSLSCQNAATDLLFTLNKIKMKDRQQKSESIRKGLRSLWS